MCFPHLPHARHHQQTAQSCQQHQEEEKGQPDQPLVRRVQLVSENARVLVAETWSDATGAYRFELIDPSQRYTVVSYDYKQMYRAVIADNLRPEMMP